MDLNFTSNIFFYNKAFNGGALYLDDAPEIDQDIRPITFIGNRFDNNIAEDFGGAIYSGFSKMYTAIVSENTFSNNSAGIMGGGIFSPKKVDKCIFKTIKEMSLVDNKVNSFENNYTSNPSYIKLLTTLSNPIIIKSGEYLPLSFGLYDEFDNYINDISAYYSSMNLKVSLELKEGSNINNSENFVIKGNIGSFVNGIEKQK